MKRKSWFGVGGSIAGAIAILAGCNAVLGIDEAKLALDAGPGGGNPYSLSCANYCSVMNRFCQTGTPASDNTEYLSDPICNKICNDGFPAPADGGVVDAEPPAPTSGDLYCRIWHANFAGQTGLFHEHCAHAGPLGGNTCDDSVSDPCAVFCALDLKYCTDPSQYRNMTDCLNTCRADAGYPGFPYQVDPANNAVTDLAATGNTLNCRMYHLENVLLEGPSIHCPHTGPEGGGPGFCVDNP